MKRVFAIFILLIFVISFGFPLLSTKVFAQNSAQVKKQIGIKVDPIGPNIAVGKNIFSDSEAPTNPATLANDGDETTFWSAQDAGIHWLKIDLGDVYATLFATEIIFNGNGSYQYKIEYSIDDNRWTVLVDKSNNADTLQTQYDKFIPPASGIRYIRVTITSTPNNQPASIKEFKVYKMVDDTFIKGADVSMLKQIEDCGGKFYLNGVQMDALEILKYFGVNWIRLRIWNHPYYTEDKSQPMGGGNCDAENMLVIAKRGGCPKTIIFNNQNQPFDGIKC
ncbi:glycosyl hydrolase 53 domain protein [Caldicellulosiruptor owensensis OL]|uniref:Arabinogalactan endo-beta-1,4-galactanase n=1 Tax=Caldicellulosiruptor owensensis (strain ATCC 700167 / DSM 13100 / OL) TaxID=632518 RepID=E4Q499_CALOW|nr:discoidin domain-containing protein [Caldicellulosiruptor owensensis]ADQ04061.1 glycosyl hydrolase 53 domain protein [Caldicellulosiruptor owensensis OL]